MRPAAYHIARGLSHRDHAAHVGVCRHVARIAVYREGKRPLAAPYGHYARIARAIQAQVVVAHHGVILLIHPPFRGDVGLLHQPLRYLLEIWGERHILHIKPLILPVVGGFLPLALVHRGTTTQHQALGGYPGLQLAPHVELQLPAIGHHPYLRAQDIPLGEYCPDLLLMPLLHHHQHPLLRLG